MPVPDDKQSVDFPRSAHQEKVNFTFRPGHDLLNIK